MNYFELFDIPVAFTVNKAELTRTYVKLQKQYHPDFFGQESDEAQEKAMEMSSLINQAWKTFQTEDATVKYVLQLHGMLEEEEKFALPPAFLMEVMELNEMRMDGADAASIKQRVDDLQAEIKTPVSGILTSTDTASLSENALQQVKTWYYQKKYLDRLLAE
ncbi:Fe-S protein assembly co-chaperone HscB [Phnomibacter ginsenosidimutans]|uniref:Fe-S protein assembly co-chaperone HscB n=1 Tax=Phnomibacter ginsenosidimutans TaxID=2676868 RepID=A0A6I6GAI5_9BACT|nr:Fe-S protein assembly co-chaperone HscB [Phnomibacter ginsenosidimutans]QGW28633.1 Fe-S protein assembly co-chaperone HscB [Phnomibacter ginsenosidimutans]